MYSWMTSSVSKYNVEMFQRMELSPSERTCPVQSRNPLKAQDRLLITKQHVIHGYVSIIKDQDYDRGTVSLSLVWFVHWTQPVITHTVLFAKLKRYQLMHTTGKSDSEPHRDGVLVSLHDSKANSWDARPDLSASISADRMPYYLEVKASTYTQNDGPDDLHVFRPGFFSSLLRASHLCRVWILRH